MAGGGGPNTIERLSTRAVLGNRAGLSNGSRSEVRNTQASNGYPSSRHVQQSKKRNSSNDEVEDEGVVEELSNGHLPLFSPHSGGKRDVDFIDPFHN